MSKKLPNEDQIQVRAYEIYLNRGGEHGHALEDWLAAETELMAQSEGAPAQREISLDTTEPRRNVAAAGSSK